MAQQHEDRTSLRMVFDEAALDYEAIRPGYPGQLIEDIIALSGIPAHGHILEIGCGTGQATVPFAQRGYTIVCLEPGKNLAAVAAQKLRDNPNVQIVTETFEDWTPEEDAFDLVVSATAFHWIPREVGYPKAAQVLKAAGVLAVFSNEHPPSYTGFFDDVQAVYEKIVPEQAKTRTVPQFEDSIRANEAYINSTGLFEPVIVKTYPWTAEYTTEHYLQLLNTYSGHRSLEEPRRTRLFQAIRELIESKYGGKVTKQYLAVLYLAKKRQAESGCP